MEKIEQPLVSIVMVNYNHEEYIGKSIESVLAQTYEKVETYYYRRWFNR